ncbi:MAG: NADH-quinone oxidoreductase subunit NuoN [Actinomycetota bacterium]|nr:NADH-quinone oxidoreductase subunit NuoN [Actinomycetota bacterium]MDQ2957895.1 NADH-quinone oxidoreductase subunit NuoN [Actinomycetota bacterium]
MSQLSVVSAAGIDPSTLIHAPSISYAALAPILIVLAAACLGVLVEALVPRALRFNTQLGLTLAALFAALIDVIAVRNTSVVTAASALSIDGVSLFIQATILVLAALSVLLMAERGVESGSAIVASAAVVVGSPADRKLAGSTRVQTEIFPLLLFAVSGMLIFPAANNLLVMFVALEVLSLPLYLMAGLSRRRRLLSQEAAIKYFLLGAFASAFFLYGLALLYGYANSVDLVDILKAQNSSGQSDTLLYLGFGLLLVGLLFKAGIAPFHSWTPDVYQGSPTAVTAFMASCTKIAAFGAILRVLYVGFSVSAWDWRPIVWAVAIASMVVGAVVGLTQTDLKRILAYSSIAHAGFILVGLVSLDSAGLSSVLFYLASYGFTTVAAFGLLMLVRDGNGGEASHLSQWSGLAKRSPLFAATFTFLLLALAGIPLTSGFIGKFVVFRAAYHIAGPLVVIALVTSAIAAFFYLRIVVMMFFAEPAEDGPTIAIPSALSSISITVGTAATLVLGVFPQPLLDLADKAAKLRG